MLQFKNKKSFTDSESAVHLISDIDETGKEAYYFIRVPNQRLAQFIKDVKSTKPMDISQYGEVVYSAYGDYPPRHIQNWARTEHGWQG